MKKQNPVSWFEIYVDDMSRAVAFYQTVLDISLEELPTPDTVEELSMMTFPMEMTENGASGALCQMKGVSAGGNSTMVYFNCEDCAIEESRVEAAGGKVFKPKMSIGEFGFISLASDTEGNMIGLHSMK